MLEAEKVYHIYNQANGNENLFREERNYPFFLERYKTHLQPVASPVIYGMVRVRPLKASK